MEAPSLTVKGRPFPVSESPDFLLVIHQTSERWSYLTLNPWKTLRTLLAHFASLLKQIR